MRTLLASVLEVESLKGKRLTSIQVAQQLQDSGRPGDRLDVRGDGPSVLNADRVTMRERPPASAQQSPDLPQPALHGTLGPKLGLRIGDRGVDRGLGDAWIEDHIPVLVKGLPKRRGLRAVIRGSPRSGCVGRIQPHPGDYLRCH